MSQEVVLIACAVLGAILVPSLITVRPPSHYAGEEDLSNPSSPVLSSQALGSQPTE